MTNICATTNIETNRLTVKRWTKWRGKWHRPVPVCDGRQPVYLVPVHKHPRVRVALLHVELVSLHRELGVLWQDAGATNGQC